MASYHRRNTAPMLSSPRCCAYTRKNELCRSPAISGKSLCRMHVRRSTRSLKEDRKLLLRGLNALMLLEERGEVRDLIDRVNASLDEIAAELDRRSAEGAA